MTLSQLPNLITLTRIAAAPALILFLKDERFGYALLLFVAAGISDGLDGWLAKHYGWQTRLGAVLDPLADKMLIVTAYVMLTLLERLPFWLVLTVAFRDLLIVGGYLMHTSMNGPPRMRPSVMSKFNTLMQIVLVVAVLAEPVFHWPEPLWIGWLVGIVFATTIVSGAHYLWLWVIRREVEPANGGPP